MVGGGVPIFRPVIGMADLPLGGTTFISGPDNQTVGGWIANAPVQASLLGQVQVFTSGPAGGVTIPLTIPPAYTGTLVTLTLTDGTTTTTVQIFVVSLYFYNTVDQRLYKIVNGGSPTILTTGAFTSNDAAMVTGVVPKISKADSLTAYLFPQFTNQSTVTNVLKTTNGGTTWSISQVLAIAGTRDGSGGCIHPTDKNTVWFLSRRNGLGTNIDEGIYKTTNGGTSWTQVLNNFKPREGDGTIAVSPDNPLVVLACKGSDQVDGTNSGIWRTADGGTTWADVASEDNYRSNSLEWIQGKPGVVMYYGNLAPGNTRRIRISTDYGVTWSTLQTLTEDFLRIISNGSSIGIISRNSDNSIFTAQPYGNSFNLIAYKVNGYLEYANSYLAPTLFMSRRDAGNLYSSTDGVNWTQRITLNAGVYSPNGIGVL